MVKKKVFEWIQKPLIILGEYLLTSLAGLFCMKNDKYTELELLFPGNRI